MRKYEAMFILRPDLSEDEKKTLFAQIQDTVAKNKGTVAQAGAWAEKKRLYFKIKKYWEGIFYLVNFTMSEPRAIAEIRRAWRLNENILRVLIIQVE